MAISSKLENLKKRKSWILKKKQLLCSYIFIFIVF